MRAAGRDTDAVLHELTQLRTERIVRRFVAGELTNRSYGGGSARAS